MVVESHLDVAQNLFAYSHAPKNWTNQARFTHLPRVQTTAVSVKLKQVDLFLKHNKIQIFRACTLPTSDPW